MDLSGKVALVTGASGGIGSAAARALAEKGCTAALTGRNREKLESVRCKIEEGGGKARVYTADLLEESERSDLIGRVNADLGHIDIFINNAGSGWYGYTYDMEWKTCREMLRLNIEAVVHMTLMVLKEMREEGRGHIVHVGSIAGLMPIQGISLYSSSKAFVRNFSVSLYREMRRSGVHVGCILPSAVRTDFFQTAAEKTNGRSVPAGEGGMKPETVARRILSLLKRPRKIAVVPHIFSVLPFVDMVLGWLIDLLGPVLLRKADGKAL